MATLYDGFVFIRFIYNLGLIFALLFLLPSLFRKKGRDALKGRLGLLPISLKSSASRRIWVHACSVGEAKAIIPLVKQIRKVYPDAFMAFSTTTLTGLKEVQKECPEANVAFLLPLDLFIRKWVKEMAPTEIILSETDFWYNFLDEAKRQGAKTYLVNGKLSKRSLQGYRYILFLFDLIDLYIVQAEVYKQRFIELGVPEAKIHVGGNLKLDKGVPELSPLPAIPTLVVGSTHDPEERLFLETIKAIWVNFPALKVYLVPRHPERFEHVAALIASAQIPFSRSSKGAVSPEEKLVLVDEMGKLASLYKHSTLAAVAGSWTAKVGGHNIFEPSFYGRPVLFGPYMHSQPDLVDQMLAIEGGIQVEADDLKGAIENLLQNPYQARAIGERGLRYLENSRGATENVFKLIFER